MKGGLDEERTNELKEAFDLFDENGDGTLGKRELHVLLQAIGRNMDSQEIDDNIRRLKQDQQQNEDGGQGDARPDELNQEEFIQFISQIQQDTVTEELREAYRKFSGTDDPDIGFTREKLKETMIANGGKLDDHEWELLFTELDADDDGVINFTDFVRAMMMR